jgi:hypothetical protein
MATGMPPVAGILLERTGYRTGWALYVMLAVGRGRP